jgi:hypothetical protein
MASRQLVSCRSVAKGKQTIQFVLGDVVICSHWLVSR